MSARAPMTLAERMAGPAPAERLLGTRRESSATGEPLAVLPVQPRLVDAAGRLPAGALFLATDVALGLALERRLPDGMTLLTSHMHIDLAPVASWPDAETTCVPQVVSLDPRSGLAAGRFGAGGDAIGQTSARFTVVGVTDPAFAVVSPDAPYPAEGEIEDSEVIDVDELVGLRVTSAFQQTVTASGCAHRYLANERGGVHGGMGGLLVERFATQAVRTWVGEDRLVTPVELRVFFSRAVAADGGTLRATTTRRRLGRRIALSSTAVHDGQGNEILFGDAVHLIEGVA